jgi:molybdopterin-guanine dinucleotide biosynthesis protein A
VRSGSTWIPASYDALVATPAPDSPVPFVGVVLAGGSSSRMGSDKALLRIGDRPLALVAADALRDGGAERVVAVGGDASALAALGIETIADDHPGQGPLGGIITALRAAPDDVAVVMVLPCDMPAIDGASVAAIVAALQATDEGNPVGVAAPTVDGRRQILTAAYRRSLLPILEQAFASGERAPRRALDRADIAIVEVVGLDIGRLGDVDRPGDIDRYAHPEPTRKGAT